MNIKEGDLFDVRISDIEHHGRGLVRMDGFVVFVDHAVPQDIARIRITKKKKSYAEASVVSISEPSLFRKKPECVYSDTCGGCTWQYLEYNKQLEYKQRHVAEALEHIGNLKGIKVHPTICCEKTFGYRNKMEFSCSGRALDFSGDPVKKDNNTGFALGLHVSATSEIVDINKCLLQPELGNSILNKVKDYIKNSCYPGYDLKNHTGFWRFIMLRNSVAYNEWMVNLVTSKKNMKAVQPLADMLTSEYPEIVSVVNNVTSRKAALVAGEYEIPVAGKSYITEKINGLEFQISANSFFQTNTAGAESLYETVKNYAGVSGNESLVDVYSGTGAIAILLADSVCQVTGMELVKSAVDDAIINCKKNNISNCRFIHRDIQQSFPVLQKRPDVMIINPPRTGIHKYVIKQILNIEPERIVCVSCNPATLARDLSRLNEKYKILEIQPLDMFPNTYHIESVARLVKA
jgi:23S rRNA (uracil1939-C5)-methyltransferase